MNIITFAMGGIEILKQAESKVYEFYKDRDFLVTCHFNGNAPSFSIHAKSHSDTETVNKLFYSYTIDKSLLSEAKEFEEFIEATSLIKNIN